MRITVSKVKQPKERIVFTLSGDTDIEKKVMRSIASANFGEKLLIKHISHPTVEIKIDTDLKKAVPREWRAPNNTSPEANIKKNEAALDEEEVKAAHRTLQMQAMLRSLGGKLPKSIAKKFYCRCGLEFVSPSEFLGHRHICPVLNIIEKDLFARGELLKKQQDTPPVIKKKKEAYECRCGHVFPQKRMFKKHQQRCTVLLEAEDLFVRSKDYLDRAKKRHKDEGHISKAPRTKKKIILDDRVHHKAKKRNAKGKRTT